MIIIDATGATLGRLASYVAKQALLGKEIIIVNCENAIITGRKRMIISRYQTKRNRGGGYRQSHRLQKSYPEILSV